MMDVKLIEGGKRARVTLGEGGMRVAVEIDAATLSVMLNQLAAARAGMSPPAVSEVVTQGDRKLDTPARRWAIRERDDGAPGVAIMLGHEGVGWVRTHLSRDDAQRVSRGITLMLLDPKATGKQ